MGIETVEWRCELVGGPDHSKMVFVKGTEPPASIFPPRHLKPKPGWGGLEDPYYYEEMPIIEYVLDFYDPETMQAVYMFKDN